MLQEPVNQSPRPEDAESPATDSQSTSSESGQSSSPSVGTMSPLARLSLERHFDSDTTTSLDWDNNSLTVNLSNPLERSNLFSISSVTSESDNDSVFDPVLFVPPSPPSPFLRVTRGLLREGTFARTSQMEPFVRVSESVSGPESPFLRENPLRRPLQRPIQRVRFEIESAEIADRQITTADRSRQHQSRQRLESIRETESD